MSTKKHAIIFFTKVPTPGLTKTRLTKEHGGIFTPEEAADLYRAVMLDTATVGFRALEILQKEATNNNGQDVYDFFVCATPVEDHPRIKEIFEEIESNIPLHFISDKGSNFNEHFNDSYQQLWAKGYVDAVAIGGDQPQMTTAGIIKAFNWLENFANDYEGLGLVHCPCQACGVSLVGMTRDTPMDFEGVFYNPNGVAALDAIINICDSKGIPVAALETVADIDNVEDLAHALSLARSQAYTARYQPGVLVPERFLAWAEEVGLQVSTPPNDDHDPRELIDA